MGTVYFRSGSWSCDKAGVMWSATHVWSTLVCGQQRWPWFMSVNTISARHLFRCVTLYMCRTTCSNSTCILCLQQCIATLTKIRLVIIYMINANVIYIFVFGAIRIHNENPLVGICIGCEYGYTENHPDETPNAYSTVGSSHKLFQKMHCVL